MVRGAEAAQKKKVQVVLRVHHIRVGLVRKCVVCDGQGIATAATGALEVDGQQYPVCADCDRSHSRAVDRGRESPFVRFLFQQVEVAAVDGRAYHWCRA